MQVSAHAKQRMEERLENWSKTTKPVKVFENALKYGKSIKQFYGTFREYLETTAAKYPQTSLMVYAGNVFVYEVRKKILITVWNIPEEYMPWKDYLKVNRNEVNKQEALERKEEEKLLKIVRKKGLSPKYYKGEFKEFLMNYSDWTVHVKTYEDVIYVYDAANNILIEKLDVPEQYKPITQYLKDDIEKEGNNMLEEILATRPNIERKRGRVASDSEIAIYDSKLLEIGYKECRSCGEVKKLENFSPRKGGDGYQSYCCECHQKLYSNKDTQTPTQTDITTKPTQTDSSSFEIQTINQVFGFSEYLHSHNITDKEFTTFLDSYNKDIYTALEIFNHLSKESQDLYMKIRKGDD